MKFCKIKPLPLDTPGDHWTPRGVQSGLRSPEAIGIHPSGANAGCGHCLTDGIVVLTLLEAPVRAIADGDGFTI